jgi:hypothetical protein
MAAQPVSPPPQPGESPVTPAARPRRPDTPAGPSLSPSRAADFKTCPLLFRFRTVDKLPETPSADQVRGTLVHAVLERLFDLPAVDRTPEAAAALVAPEWDKLVGQEPELASIFATEPPVRGRPAPSRHRFPLRTGSRLRLRHRPRRCGRRRCRRCRCGRYGRCRYGRRRCRRCRYGRCGGRRWCGHRCRCAGS